MGIRRVGRNNRTSPLQVSLRLVGNLEKTAAKDTSQLALVDASAFTKRIAFVLAVWFTAACYAIFMCKLRIPEAGLFAAFSSSRAKTGNNLCERGLCHCPPQRLLDFRRNLVPILTPGDSIECSINRSTRFVGSESTAGV